MAKSSRFRFCLAWLALCAMCFGAVAPTVSKWLAASQEPVGAYFCRENGAAWAALDDTPFPHGTHSPAAVGDHCPYCALVHHLPFVPPGTAGAALPLAAAVVAYVPVAADSYLPSPERHVHTPRAPPAFS